MTATQNTQRKLISGRFRRGRGTAINLSPKQRDLVREVTSRIDSGRYQLLHQPCACGGDSGIVVSEVDRYGLPLNTVLCQSCGTLRFDPYLDAASLTDFYVSYYQDMYARVSDPDVYFARQQSYGNRILDFVRPRLRSNCLVVEVGCGAGGALSVFQAAGYQTGGCDYSAHLIELGKKRGLTNLFHGDIDALVTGIGADRKADLIILHHVFEHLSDPAQFLEKAKSFLAPEGTILVAVPDVSRADQFPDPDGDLRQFFHIAHKFNFSLTGMQALAARVTMKAHTAQVRESTQAPEFWVAFARPSASGDEAHSRQTPTSLYARLRRIELGYVRRAALRKLSRPFLRCANSLAGMVTGTRR